MSVTWSVGQLKVQDDFNGTSYRESVQVMVVRNSY